VVDPAGKLIGLIAPGQDDGAGHSRLRLAFGRALSGGERAQDSFGEPAHEVDGSENGEQTGNAASQYPWEGGPVRERRNPPAEGKHGE
jgi:hypothetical protein